MTGILVQRSHVEHRATVYEVTAMRDTVDGQLTIMATTGLALHQGEWLRLPMVDMPTQIAWSYLVEKMPGLGKHLGDEEGWRMAFRDVGIEVI